MRMFGRDECDKLSLEISERSLANVGLTVDLALRMSMCDPSQQGGQKFCVYLSIIIIFYFKHL